jgi:hypothetical protein
MENIPCQEINEVVEGSNLYKPSATLEQLVLPEEPRNTDGSPAFQFFLADADGFGMFWSIRPPERIGFLGFLTARRQFFHVFSRF